MKFILVILLNGIFLRNLDASETEKCPIRCTCSNEIADCRRMGKEFPKPDEVPDGVTSIVMDDNNIEKLQQIPEIKTLHRLSIAHNNINEIEFDAFDNLDELTSLDLSFNKISAIADDIFEWNPLKLQILYLNDNLLEYVQHFLFYDLEELTELYLQNNQITFIHNHAFLQLKKLRRLRLDGNKLHTFQSKWIEKLQSNNFATLQFNNNPWSCDCDMNDTVSWLKSDSGNWFKTLTLDNPLMCVRPSLFANQQIATVNQTTLKTCNKPRIMQISKAASVGEGKDVLLQCVVATDDEHFPAPQIYWTAPNNDTYRLQNALNFEGIEVHQNGSLLIRNFKSTDAGDYVCTAKNSQGSHSAKSTLTFDKSQAVHKDEDDIPDEAVAETDVKENTGVSVAPHVDCPKVCQCISENIDCAGDGSTPITTFPNGIPITARSINLAVNKLTHLSENQFIRFANLEEIRLDNNEIHTIDVNAFRGLSKVTTLTMRDNQITAIQDGTFKDMTRLNVLVLDNNFIQSLNRDMFKGLVNLSWLYLRNNKIDAISKGVFLNLQDIKFIHLENNELSTLDVDFVSDVRQSKSNSIQKVFVDDNSFYCDRTMEPLRQLLNKDTTLENFFGDGLICSYPPEYHDVNLAEIKTSFTNVLLESHEISEDVEEKSHTSSILIGGIILGIILAIVIMVAWKKWGKKAKTLGRSYNYTNVGGDDMESKGLTEPTYSGRDTEAFV